MKAMTTIIWILILSLLWVGSANSIDKTGKDSKTKKPEVVAADKTDKSGQEDTQPQTTDQAGSRSKTTYDDFIDTNNNGIDDRAEKKAITGKTKKPEPNQGASKKKKQ